LASVGAISGTLGSLGIYFLVLLGKFKPISL